MEWIDLRSDTVTQPTEQMRKAMEIAEVGDDVYGEDPTINRLQEMSAARLGKEAGLFVPSGTMGNLAAILAHCARGEEVILGHLSHTYLYEAGGTAVLGGIPSYILQNQSDGTILMGDLVAAIHPEDVHQPMSRLFCIENTHNRCGGSPLTVEYTRSLCDTAHEHGLLVHIDGARIFNAAAALGVSPSELCSPADSVTYCLSKGLGAPVGSVICGTSTFIRKAHRIRKQLGGGMRQAGILAAAGIVALEVMVDRLGEDHQRAKRFSDAIGKYPGIHLDYATPPSNMVFFQVAGVEPQDFVRLMAKKKIRIGSPRGSSFRVVFHYQIDDPALDHVLESFTQIFGRA
jgi:threonine aldolase